MDILTQSLSAFFSKAKVLVDLDVFVTSSDEMELFGILELQGQKQAQNFKTVFSSVNIVAQEEIIEWVDITIFAWSSPAVKESQQIFKLTMQISINLCRNSQMRNEGLSLKELDWFINQSANLLNLQWELVILLGCPNLWRLEQSVDKWSINALKIDGLGLGAMHRFSKVTHAWLDLSGLFLKLVNGDVLNSLFFISIRSNVICNSNSDLLRELDILDESLLLRKRLDYIAWWLSISDGSAVAIVSWHLLHRLLSSRLAVELWGSDHWLLLGGEGDLEISAQVDLDCGFDGNIWWILFKTTITIKHIFVNPAGMSESLDDIILAPVRTLTIVDFQRQCFTNCVGSSSKNNHQWTQKLGIMLESCQRLFTMGIVGSLYPIPLAISMSSESPSFIIGLLICSSTSKNDHHSASSALSAQSSWMIDPLWGKDGAAVKIELLPWEGTLFNIQQPDIIDWLVAYISSEDDQVGLEENYCVSISSARCFANDWDDGPLSFFFTIFQI